MREACAVKPQVSDALLWSSAWQTAERRLGAAAASACTANHADFLHRWDGPPSGSTTPTSGPQPRRPVDRRVMPAAVCISKVRWHFHPVACSLPHSRLLPSCVLHVPVMSCVMPPPPPAVISQFHLNSLAGALSLNIYDCIREARGLDGYPRSLKRI